MKTYRCGIKSDGTITSEVDISDYITNFSLTFEYTEEYCFLKVDTSEENHAILAEVEELTPVD